MVKNRATVVLNSIYKKNNESLCSQCVCLRIFLSIPVSFASEERSFRKLALMKIFVCSPQRHRLGSKFYDPFPLSTS